MNFEGIRNESQDSVYKTHGDSFLFEYVIFPQEF